MLAAQQPDFELNDTTQQNQVEQKLVMSESDSEEDSDYDVQKKGKRLGDKLFADDADNKSGNLQGSDIKQMIKQL